MRKGIFPIPLDRILYDVFEIIEEVKREHPSLEKWTGKKILDFFAEIFPEMDNIAEEKNTEIFDAKC